MLDGIVMRNSLIEVRSGFCQSPCKQQRSAHEAMPNHERDRRPPLLGEGEELRAAMSMARLWRDQGKRQEAHKLLAPVFSWFTEGFDTLDLKEAKSLLEQLKA